MSKCSVVRIRKSKFSYSTLLRPKYCAAAGDAVHMQTAATSVHTNGRITPMALQLLIGCCAEKRQRGPTLIQGVSNLRAEVSQERNGRAIHQSAREHVSTRK